MMYLVTIQYCHIPVQILTIFESFFFISHLSQIMPRIVLFQNLGQFNMTNNKQNGKLKSELTNG